MIKERSNKAGRECLSQLPQVDKVRVWFAFLNLGGVPPLPGFLLKVGLLRLFRASLLTLVLFLIRSALLIYIYLRLRILALLSAGKRRERGLPRATTFFYGAFQVWAALVVFILLVGVTT